jgi:GH24 family phage-related lysozyme (muramidase)
MPDQPEDPNGVRQINQAGLDLIKSFEGLRLEAYQDSVGVWTIGYGHIRNVTEGMSIDNATAERFLREDLSNSEAAVESAAPGLTDNQFAALCSFCFNLGSGALNTMLGHGIDQVPQQIPRWNRAGGQVLAGLTRRRAAEVALWETA